MPYTPHSYTLGKDWSLSFAGAIANKDVKTVTFTRETAAEAEVTTRGTGNYQEFVPVRENVVVEVVVLDHAALMHQTGTLVITPPSGSSFTGAFYVNSISLPQELDGAVESTITLRKFVGA